MKKDFIPYLKKILDNLHIDNADKFVSSKDGYGVKFNIPSETLRVVENKLSKALENNTKVEKYYFGNTTDGIQQAIIWFKNNISENYKGKKTMKKRKMNEGAGAAVTFHLEDADIYGVDENGNRITGGAWDDTIQLKYAVEDLEISDYYYGQKANFGGYIEFKLEDIQKELEAIDEGYIGATITGVDQEEFPNLTYSWGWTRATLEPGTQLTWDKNHPNRHTPMLRVAFSTGIDEENEEYVSVDGVFTVSDELADAYAMLGEEDEDTYEESYKGKKTMKKRMNEDAKIIGNLFEFNPWSGAVDTWKKIVDADMLVDLDRLIEEIYPDGITMTELNDLLWFEDDWVLEQLGLAETEDEEEYDESLKPSRKSSRKMNEYKTKQLNGKWVLADNDGFILTSDKFDTQEEAEAKIKEWEEEDRAKAKKGGYPVANGFAPKRVVESRMNEGNYENKDEAWLDFCTDVKKSADYTDEDVDFTESVYSVVDDLVYYADIINIWKDMPGNLGSRIDEITNLMREDIVEGAMDSEDFIMGLGESLKPSRRRRPVSEISDETVDNALSKRSQALNYARKKWTDKVFDRAPKREQNKAWKEKEQALDKWWNAEELAAKRKARKSQTEALSPEEEQDFRVVRKNAKANPNLYGGRYTQKSIKDARAEYEEDIRARKSKSESLASSILKSAHEALSMNEGAGDEMNTWSFKAKGFSKMLENKQPTFGTSELRCTISENLDGKLEGVVVTNYAMAKEQVEEALKEALRQQGFRSTAITELTVLY